jgi:hypothetical protein
LAGVHGGRRRAGGTASPPASPGMTFADAAGWRQATGHGGAGGG